MIPDTLAPIANHLWQSTLFAAAVGLLTLALRHNRAAIRYALWLAASAKFLFPFSLLVAVGSQFQGHTAAVIAPDGLPVAIDQMLAPPVFHAAAGHAMMSTASPVILAVWALGLAAVLFSWWRAWRPIRAALHRATPLRLSVPGLPTFLDVRCSPDLLEPAVIGVWRPVLLLPDGITDRLQPSELQAVLAHELCHIRRRDNLTAMIQMLVEALFWFHPLVWWLEARLLDERERACDEEVLRSGNDPVVYAESILKICRFYVHSQLACASKISGADLKSRVEEIMINRVSIRMNAGRKFLLAASAAVVVALSLAAGVGASHQNMLLALKGCKTLITDADVNLMKARGADPIRNTITVQKDGEITWNGRKLTMIRLRQYLDQTANIVPMPYIILNTQAGYDQHNLDEVKRVIYKSGNCNNVHQAHGLVPPPRPQARAGTQTQAAFASRIALVSLARQDVTAIPVVTAIPAMTASPAVIASPAVPASPAVEWVTNDDYPKSALREERQGKTAFRLTVGIDGRAKECFVTTSSGSPDLDEAACLTLLKRARFNPATDEFGKPREGLWVKTVNWVIPKD